MCDLYRQFGTKERKEERKKYLQTVHNILKFVKYWAEFKLMPIRVYFWQKLYVQTVHSSSKLSFK